ncbi:MAG: hypothetical protein GY751_23100 [Bacteroidetes bacterium]|nr:hypothetical protein [Bacteroidota bacterium]
MLTEVEHLQLRNAARDLAQISGSDRAVLFNSTLEAQSTAGVQDQLAYYRDNAGSLTGAENRDFMILLVAVALEGMGQLGDGKSMKMGGCSSCGSSRPDLARSSGGLRIDPDGASTYCATCLRNGETNAKSGTYWIKSYDDYETEALTTNVGAPRYSPEHGRPGHFSVFQGGPTNTTTSLWKRLNQFIRTNKTNFKLR